MRVSLPITTLGFTPGFFVSEIAGEGDEVGLRRADGVQQRRVLLAEDAPMQIGDLHDAQA